MRLVCKDCGSEDIAQVRDGRVLLVHEVDFRHIGHDLTDDDLAKVKHEALAAAAGVIEGRIEQHKGERDARERLRLKHEDRGK